MRIRSIKLRRYSSGVNEVTIAIILPINIERLQKGEVYQTIVVALALRGALTIKGRNGRVS
jgi:hypothetical protein